MPVKDPSKPTLDDFVVPTVPTRIVLVRKIRFQAVSPAISSAKAGALMAIKAAAELHCNTALRESDFIRTVFWGAASMIADIGITPLGRIGLSLSEFVAFTKLIVRGSLRTSRRFPNLIPSRHPAAA